MDKKTAHIPSALFKILSILLHLSLLGVLALVFIPFVQWYIDHRPVLGVDFYNTASYARYLRDFGSIFPSNFKFFTYMGYPVFADIVQTWFFIVSLFARVIPLIQAVKFSSLLFFYLLLLFVYLSSYRLSKNHFLSLLVASLVSFSANMYGSLTWGGSLPYFANQMFFPAILWALSSYLDTGEKKWFSLGILFLGIGFLGHLANVGAFVVPGAILLLLFGTRIRPVTIPRKLFEIFILFFTAYFFAYRATRGLVSGLFQHFLEGKFLNPYGLGEKSATKVNVTTTGVTVTGNADLIAFERSHFQTLWTDTTKFLFILFIIALIVFIVGFVVDKKKRKALFVVPWILLLIYSTLHVFLNSYGISVLPQAWYRAFWHFPVSLGLASAALLGYGFESIKRSLSKLSKPFYITIASISAVILFFTQINNEMKNTLQKVEDRSSISSAHPQALNLIRNDKELEFLKTKLIPEWIDPNERNYTMFTSDAQLNVWWTALYNLPLTRGYLDPPIGTGFAGHNFLLDQSVGGDDIVRNFNYPQEVAKNMALYFIDWYSVKYAEGGRLSQSPNKPPSSYLEEYIDRTEEVEVYGGLLEFETKSGKPEIKEDLPQYLKYYKFKDEIVSPIVAINNSPTLLCICDWGAYESLTKVLAMNNINSQNLVTSYYRENIDTLSKKDLSSFDLVVLDKYKYSNKHSSFSKLLDYVKQGGNLIIDTGTEVPESAGNKLPELFPFSSSTRSGLGKEWDLEVRRQDIFENVDISSFSEPVFNDEPWSFSYPTDELLPGSEIILLQNGKPIIASRSIEKGKVVWSGMNLAYHAHSKTNYSESVLYSNIIRSMIDISKSAYEGGKLTFTNDRKLKITSSQPGKGILLKMENWDGWDIKVNGKKVKAFSSGPTFPGFIYVPLNGEKSIAATFEYRGMVWWYLLKAVQLFILIFILDQIIFNGNILWIRLIRLGNIIHIQTKSWWKNEEQD